MRTACVFLCCLPFLAGCGGRNVQADPYTQTVGGLTAHLELSPPELRVGHDGTFIVYLTEGGQPVRGARVLISLTYKTMNQEGPEGFATEVAPGRYELRDVSTGMNGQWMGAIRVSRVGLPEVTFRFPFRVGK